jgi:site-specific DNA recombinase
VTARLAELQERIGLVEGRVRKVREQMQAIRERMLDENEAATALSLFDPLWGTLTPAEQVRVIGLLVERVDYDGAQGKVTISFHPTGIRALADELADRTKERRA